MKQSKGLNGDLKPQHKKTTNRTTMNPTSLLVWFNSLKVVYREK